MSEPEGVARSPSGRAVISRRGWDAGRHSAEVTPLGAHAMLGFSAGSQNVSSIFVIIGSWDVLKVDRQLKMYTHQHSSEDEINTLHVGIAWHEPPVLPNVYSNIM